jgi:phage shock protein A
LTALGCKKGKVVMFANILTVSLMMVAVIGGLFGLLWIINRRAARHVTSAASAQIGKMGNWLWNADPKANFQKLLDDAAEEIGDATNAIEANKALVNSLTRQVADNEREVARLDARVKNSLAEDPEDRNGKAAEYVMQLSVAQSHLAKNKDQLGKVQSLYQNNLKKIEMARGKIKEAQDRGRQLNVELDMAKTSAKISKLATSFNINSRNLEGLGEVEEQMRYQIDKYNAVSEVQTDLGTDGLKELEEEDRLRKGEAVRMLEDYKKKMLAAPQGVARITQQPNPG